MLKLKFSILSYHPSFLTNESINIGILFHCLDSKLTKFFKIKDLKKIEVFDDELDIDFTKFLFNGIENGIKPNLFTKEEFNFNNFIRFYVNEFKFSKIHTVELMKEELDDFIEKTKRDLIL